MKRKKLTKDFDQKLWMTWGLTLFGATSLGIFVTVLLQFMNREIAVRLLNYGLAHPWLCFLWGFGLVVYFSVAIYCSRMLVIAGYRWWHS